MPFVPNELLVPCCGCAVTAVSGRTKCICLRSMLSSSAARSSHPVPVPVPLSIPPHVIEQVLSDVAHRRGVPLCDGQRARLPPPGQNADRRPGPGLLNG